MSLMVSSFGTLENKSVISLLETNFPTVQLNHVLRDITGKYKEDGLRGNIIYRCENLPGVEGLTSQYYILFNHLLSILLFNWGAYKHSFLHINCQEVKKDAEGIDLSLSNGTKSFAINLSTSIRLQPHWSKQFQPQIQECIELLLMNKGDLQIYSERITGCLFTVLLPGKLS
jgi:hypothetical protein